MRMGDTITLTCEICGRYLCAQRCPAYDGQTSELEKRVGKCAGCGKTIHFSEIYTQRRELLLCYDRYLPNDTRASGVHAIPQTRFSRVRRGERSYVVNNGTAKNKHCKLSCDLCTQPKAFENGQIRAGIFQRLRLPRRRNAKWSAACSGADVWGTALYTVITQLWRKAVSLLPLRQGKYRSPLRRASRDIRPKRLPNEKPSAWAGVPK